MLKQPALFFLFILIFGSNFVKAQESFVPKLNYFSSFELQILGISEQKGEIRIAVFDSEEKYTKDPIYAEIIPADCDVCIWSVESLPFGDYAIAVYHDKNGNGKLDTNFLGIPKESYGFSNNARGKFGPASWKDASFTVKSIDFQATITVK